MKRLILLALLMSSLGALAEKAQQVNESVVFCSDLQAGKARLLFDPVEIQSVKRADGSAVFAAGDDYLVSADGWLTLTPNSRIPVLNYYSSTIDSTLYRFKDVNGTAFYSPGGTRNIPTGILW